LRCSYCIPEGFKDYQEPEHWLNFAEIERLLAVFAACGLKRVRLTGGEPLLRRGIVDLAGRIAALPGIEDLSMSTNGTQLAKYAAALRRAGVTRLNVSLDSLDAARVAEISRRDVLDKVLEGLEAAVAAGFRPIKINMVATPGMNFAEVDAMVAFCIDKGFILRLIETMPMGDSGRQSGFLEVRTIQEQLRQRFGLVDGVVGGGGPARYLVSPDGRFQIGFITPISQHFCETCNRVRLAVDGTLYLCLGQNDKVDFRALLRAGASDNDLREALVGGLQKKPLRHEFSEQPGKVVRIMASTGG
jgi:cyclic pyranopterin phosphate synthase